MAANVHAVAASAVNVPTTTETVIATLTAFNEQQAGEFAQGVLIQATVNFLPGTGTTAVVLRIRKGSLTGTLVGVAQTTTVTAGAVTGLSCDELDTVLIQNVTYVLTAQQTGASANGTVNRVVLTAEDASAFE